MVLPLENQIREAFAREQAGARPAQTLDDIPGSYDLVSDEWLSAVICADVPGARVVAHRLDDPDEGTNNRRRIFLSYNAAGKAAGLPASVFCKGTSGLRNRLMLAHSGGIRCEVGFYRHVQHLIDFEVPRAFHANFDPVSFNSIIVLEDLAGRGNFFDRSVEGSPDLTREQLAILARLYGLGARQANLDADFAALPTWEERFRGLMHVRLDEACAAGLEVTRDHGMVPDRLWQRRREIWPATVASLGAQASLPRGFGHGDVHLHNWYRLTDGTLGLGDWGVIHRGHWGRDLGYCIAAGLPVDVRREHEDNLINFYIEEMVRAGGQRVSLEEARRIIAQAITTALAFWTMTVAPVAEMPDMQPQDYALMVTSRLATALDDWGTLDAF